MHTKFLQAVRHKPQTKQHIPVMLEEALRYLNPKPDAHIIDATLGAGGHTEAILGRTEPNGLVLGIERDTELILFIQQNKRLIIETGNYIDMKTMSAKHNFSPVSGVLFDFGMSSYHIERSGRGFSFLRDEPLDMRFGAVGDGITAADIVNSYPKDALAKLFYEYGEERYAPRIAKYIFEARKRGRIMSTFELVRVIESAVPRWYSRRKTHVATRVFQALRIAVNDELKNIRMGLEAACRLVQSGGNVVAISFHSLEHRIVKSVFKELVEQEAGRMLTRKAVRPSHIEMARNPRARSALLRAWQRL